MRCKAFTLVELMLSIAVFSMMMLGVTTAFLAGRSAWEVNQNSTDVQTQARAALWMVVRDLRQARGTFYLIQNTATAVSFSFTHSTEGVVTYSWAKDVATGAGDLVRQTSSGSRVVARNVAAIVPTDNGTEILFTLTTRHTSASGKTDSMTLTEKVVFR